ncbi:hypothetical protein BJX70DRAFT_359736 [Aspergillus crustosus]
MPGAAVQKFFLKRSTAASSSAHPGGSVGYICCLPCSLAVNGVLGAFVWNPAIICVSKES